MMINNINKDSFFKDILLSFSLRDRECVFIFIYRTCVTSILARMPALKCNLMYVFCRILLSIIKLVICIYVSGWKVG